MAFDLSSTKSKLVLGGVIVFVIVFLLWPKFKGSSDKYEEDFEEGYEEEMDEGYEEDMDEGYEEMEYDEGYEEEDMGDEESYGPMDDNYATMAPMAQAQAALQTARPDLPGINVATDLLPKPSLQATDFAEFAPKALGAQNFVDATAFVGVNTVGSALKNPNYQLRADIPIPRVDVGVWNLSSVESGDLARKPQF